MNRKIVSIAIVAMMVITSMAFIVPADESDASDSETYTAHYKPTQYYYRNDTAWFTYDGYLPVDEKVPWADILELEKKDAEFEASLNGGPAYVKSELINGHSYAVYWGPTSSRPSNCDKVITAKGDMDLIYLNSGSYTLKILNIKFVGSSHSVSFVEPYSIDRTNTILYDVKVGNEYTFTSNGFNSFAFASYSEFYIEYEISKGSVASALKDEPLTGTSINNIYAWYKCDVSMSGKYSISSDKLIFQKGSSDESRFLSEVVNNNKYYSLSEDIVNKYNSLKSGYFSDGQYSVYSLYKTVNRTVSDGLTKKDDSGNSSTQSILLERLTENKINLFSNAYTTIKIAVGNYDTERYALYLVYSETFIPLKPNMSYPIENSTAKTYTLVVYNTGEDTTDLYTEVPIYTEGVPDVDSNPDLFAGICIGLCVIIFLVVLIAGKKPRWSKKKYDRRPVKKIKDDDVPEQQEQAPANDMSQQAPAEDDVPKEGPPNEEPQDAGTEVPPKKRRFFGRRSKEE